MSFTYFSAALRYSPGSSSAKPLGFSAARSASHQAVLVPMPCSFLSHSRRAFSSAGPCLRMYCIHSSSDLPVFSGSSAIHFCTMATPGCTLYSDLRFFEGARGIGFSPVEQREERPSRLAFAAGKAIDRGRQNAFHFSPPSRGRNAFFFLKGSGRVQVCLSGGSAASRRGRDYEWRTSSRGVSGPVKESVKGRRIGPDVGGPEARGFCT